MKYQYVLIFLLLFLMNDLLLTGQPNNKPFNDGKITGTIQDKLLESTIEYATISLYQANDSSLVTGTITNPEGKFSIGNLHPGEYYLEASFIGYTTTRITNLVVTPRNPNLKLGTINLQAAVEQLDEVEVVAEKSHLEYKIDKKVINVGKDITAAGASAVEVLENIPSIQTDIDGNVQLRGSSNFTVLVDGKPSVIEGSDALQQIPASTIQSIEIITNPSAKYDPDGTAGIINVILKKQSRGGLNGIVNASAGSGPSYETDILLNYKTSKFKIFGGAEYRDRKFPGSNTIYREIYNDNSTNIISSSSEGYMIRPGKEVKAGIDYYLTEKSTLSLSGNIGQWGFGRIRDTRSREYNVPATYNDYFFRETEWKIIGNYISSNLDFQHDFDEKEHKLKASAHFSTWDGTENNEIITYNTNEFFVPFNSIADTLIGSREENTRLRLRGQIDYTKPFGEHGKLELGYQGRYNFGEGKYFFEIYDPDFQEFVVVDSLTNGLDFSRNLQSGYGTYSNLLWGLKFQLGLRLEYSLREIENITTGETWDLNLFNFFPTFHVSRQLPAKQQLQFSYSRRINRPRGYYLNPFITYIDPQTTFQGNPELKPEYVNSIELNYQKSFEKGFFSTEAYYRQTVNMIYRNQIALENNTLINSFDNLGSDYATGVEVMTNLEFFKWWNFNLSGNAFYYQLEANDNNIFIKNDGNAQFRWDLRLNNSIKFKWGSRLQLMGFYHGPAITPQGDRSEFFFVNAGIKQDFFQRKLSATFSIRDIFGTMKHSFTSYGENFMTDLEFERDTPYFTISLSYKINNYKQNRRSPGTMEMEFDGGEGGM